MAITRKILIQWIFAIPFTLQVGKHPLNVGYNFQVVSGSCESYAMSFSRLGQFMSLRFSTAAISKFLGQNITPCQDRNRLFSELLKWNNSLFFLVCIVLNGQGFSYVALIEEKRITFQRFCCLFLCGNRTRSCKLPLNVYHYCANHVKL